MTAVTSYTKAGAENTFALKNLSNPESIAAVISIIADDETVLAAAREAINQAYEDGDLLPEVDFLDDVNDILNA